MADTFELLFPAHNYNPVMNVVVFAVSTSNPVSSLHWLSSRDFSIVLLLANLLDILYALRKREVIGRKFLNDYLLFVVFMEHCGIRFRLHPISSHLFMTTLCTVVNFGVRIWHKHLLTMYNIGSIEIGSIFLS